MAAALLAWAAPAWGQTPAAPATPAPATLPNALEILGARTVDIPSATPGGKVALPAVAVRALVSPPPDRVEVIDVATDGRGGGPSGAFEVTLTPRVAATGIADLVTTVDLGKAVRSVTYVAKLLPTRGGVVVGAAFELSFVRPAGVLQVASLPLRLEVTTWAPWGPAVRPRQVDVAENTRIAGLADLRAVSTSALKGPGDVAVDGHVDVRIPSTLSAGQTARVDVSLTRHALPLGTSKGVVTLSSPNLAQPVALAIEVVTRRWLGWLVVTLALGMVTGAVVRHYLEKNAALVHARRDTQQQLERLRRVAGQQPDPELRAAMQAFPARLAEVRRDASTPETLAANTAKIVAEADALLKAADEKRTKLSADLQKLRARVMSAEPKPETLRDVLDDVSRLIALREGELKAGLVGDVERALNELEHGLLERVGDALGPWLDAVRSLGRVGAWPGTTFANERDKAIGFANDIGTGADVEADLRKVAELGVLLRREIFARGLSEISERISEVASKLPSENAALEEAGRAIVTLRSRTLTVDDVGNVAAAVGQARDALVAALEAVQPRPEAPGFLDAVSHERFIEAADLLLPSRQRAASPDNVLTGFRSQRPASIVSVDAAPELDDIVVALDPWSITIHAPAEAEAGTPVALVLQSSRPFPTTAVVRWFADGRPIAQGEPGMRIGHFTPRDSGATQIEAVVEADAGRERVTARAWIEVKAADEVTAEALSGELARWTLVRDAILGAILVAAGVMIFKGAWVGSFEDLYPAFLWGFSTDIAAAKVRELATPLASKAVPTR